MSSLERAGLYGVPQQPGGSGSRERRLMNADFDVFIIGGGINGCGIARDAAGRGYRVGLAEMNDFASGTSSASSKLVHGGLRYLEQYKFRLVREALGEREVLLQMAPHIIRPLRFILPHHRKLRPAWLLRLGLFLYDHIGNRRLLPPTRTINLRTAEVGKPLKATFARGFEYSDCWVDDARLVIFNAMDAKDRGATILSRVKVVSATLQSDVWLLTLVDQLTRERREVTTRLLVNAAGPWVDRVLSGVIASNRAANIRMVKGSHVVVPKLYEHDRAYIFQNTDGRIIFVIPYENSFSLIGTTDEDFAGDPDEVRITPEETAYLCQGASEYLKTPVHPDQVVWTYSGVRPLYDDGASAAQEATRDYVLRVDTESGQPPLINIFGGKITTYRRLAEVLLEKVEGLIGAKGPVWTANSHLPGGDFAPGDGERQPSGLLSKYPFLDRAFAERLTRSYGTRAAALLGDARSREDLGTQFGATLTEREVNYLIGQEWARTTEDIVWRRSKLGLHMTSDEIDRLRDWLGRRSPQEAVAPQKGPVDQ